MDAELRKLAMERAGNQCEYCRIRQDELPVKLHVDRIIAGQHGGSYVEDNIAIACNRCNWNKLSNLFSIDPMDGVAVPLFNPRQDVWDEHFEFEGPCIVGITAIGRATVQLLKMNADDRIRLRIEHGYPASFDKGL